MSFFTSRGVLALLERQRHLDHVRRRVGLLWRRDRAGYRQLMTLFHAADLVSPELVRAEQCGPFSFIAQVPWRRPLMTWAGGGWRGLVQHLLIESPHPMPPFLFAPPRAGLPGAAEHEGTRLMRLAHHLGGGGGLRAARQQGILPPCLTRRMDHLLLQTQDPLPLGEAVRRAQVEALGGPPWLAEALAATSAGRLMDWDREIWWQQAIAWLCAGAAELQRGQVVVLVDWLRSAGVVGSAAALRRSVRNALTDARRWHAAPYGRPGPRWRCPPGPLPDPGLATWREVRDGVLWTAASIIRGEALQEEGRALQHCVATYHRLVRARAHAIVSLRAAGRRRLTIEVRLDERAVVQARGLRNRSPTREERAVLVAWAEVLGLKVRAV